MKKLFLLTLGLLITLTACEFVPISEPSSSSEQPTSRLLPRMTKRFHLVTTP